MGGWFSKKKETGNEPSRITEQDKAILSLKQQRDKLKKYQKKINLNLEKERNLAKDLLKDGKKDVRFLACGCLFVQCVERSMMDFHMWFLRKAKTLLKKKRYQENLLQKTDDQLEALDKMVNEIEFAQVQMKVVEGLKQGNECLNQLHKMMTLEDVEKIMDETQEAVEYQREIDSLISGSFTREDEDDILAELEELTKVELPEVPTEQPERPEDLLPEVPTKEPGQAEKPQKQRQQPIAMAAT